MLCKFKGTKQNIQIFLFRQMIELSILLRKLFVNLKLVQFIANHILSERRENKKWENYNVYAAKEWLYQEDALLTLNELSHSPSQIKQFTFA